MKIVPVWSRRRKLCRWPDLFNLKIFATNRIEHEKRLGTYVDPTGVSEIPCCIIDLDIFTFLTVHTTMYVALKKKVRGS